MCKLCDIILALDNTLLVLDNISMYTLHVTTPVDKGKYFVLYITMLSIVKQSKASIGISEHAHWMYVNNIQS